jgi:NAD(P)-dependent dehydrogenase (short-subunit alcohol dehydrogenase family)
MVARVSAGIEAAAAEVNRAGGGRALAFSADVRDLHAVDAVVGATVAEFGPITALVNNAGTAGPAGVDWNVDPDDWWECIESIVRGAFNCTRCVLPGMLDRGAGRVVDVASVTGTTAWPLVSATSLAKTALIRHVENLAGACTDRGVHTFALHPGMVRTALLLSYRSNASLREFLDTAPADAFSPPELAGKVVARILAGDFDALSGRFLDATSTLDDLCAHPDKLADDTLTLRLVSP